jgi:hypothetical protein
MAGPVFYRVHEGAVLAFNAPGGEVFELIDQTAIVAQYEAKNNVNDRTGKLAGSIRKNKPKPEGGFRIAALVYTNVKYAHYVHEGTHDRTPKPLGGMYMTVPSERQGGGINPSGGQLRKDYLAAGGRAAYPGRKPYFLAKSISGQDANPFLADGMREAMAGDPRLGFTGI